MAPIRVLLMGGRPIFLELVTLFLERYDDMAVVGTYGDAQEGLAQMQILRPQVVVTDLGTPGLTGLETIARLRNVMPDVGIAATSLLNVNSYRDVALLAGADDLVPQAGLVTGLLPAIRQVVRSAELYGAWED